MTTHPDYIRGFNDAGSGTTTAPACYADNAEYLAGLAAGIQHRRTGGNACTVVEAISRATVARLNCIARGNADATARWDRYLSAIQRECLPSGSGFDNGTAIVGADSASVVLRTAFHHMDEQGSYDGWTTHRVTARASFALGMELTIGGPNRNDIKDYIADVFQAALSAPLPARITYGAEGR